MKNTLRNKLIVTGALLTSLGFGSGCAGLGAVYMQSDDPLTRATGTIMHYEGMHQDRMEESAAGRSEVNVNVGSESNSSNYVKHGKIPPKCYTWLTNDYDDLRVRPKNTILRVKEDGKIGYKPAEGYIWADKAPHSGCTIKIEQ